MTSLSSNLQRLELLTDEQVVVRILDGDIGAFELLMRRHNPRMFRLARSIVKADADAEDVVQEAYIRAYRSLPRFEFRSSTATWLSRIVFHEALRFQRRSRRVHYLANPEQAKHTEAFTNGHALSHAERAEIRTALLQSLDSLPTSSRAVIMLRLIEGLSTRETAESLRMSENNVKIVLHRAKNRFVATLTEQMIDELREHLSFDGDRCDRLVSRTFSELTEA